MDSIKKRLADALRDCLERITPPTSTNECKLVNEARAALAAYQQAEQMVNGLTEAETAATASVAGLVGKWEGAEEWMPLAWELCAEECGEDACTELVWEGGPVPEPLGDRWLKYEDEAKRLIALVRKCVPSAAAPQPQPAQPRELTDAEAYPWNDADADAARLALELECLLLSITDASVVARWWDSANEALAMHRNRLAAAAAKE